MKVEHEKDNKSAIEKIERELKKVKIDNRQFTDSLFSQLVKLVKIS